MAGDKEVQGACVSPTAGLSVRVHGVMHVTFYVLVLL